MLEFKFLPLTWFGYHPEQVLNILQNHYVETLGRGLIINLPFLLNFFFKGITPFLDPITRDKVSIPP